MVVRTRFAPSPTGSLHIGSVRTALYSWLYAKKHGGIFVLRIEDTDQERSSQASTDAILQGMEWLGLDYQEGPYYQSKRFERYQSVIDQLIVTGHAYRCDCSKERLEALRHQQLLDKQKPKYDGRCRHLDLPASTPSFVVRFKTPLEGEVSFVDLVHGEVSFQNSELDDVVLRRSDGICTYNFTVVVDDWDMEITHVVRGNDHVNNTPRQINIMQALGVTPPQYAHLPMILGEVGKRLSKRHGSVSVMHYKEAGFLPEALLNYLVRLGWSHGDQEIFSTEEMIALFDVKDIHKAAAAVNQEKLLWLNQHYLKTLDESIIARCLQEQMEQFHIPVNGGPALIDVVAAQKERSKTLAEMAERSRYFYSEVESYEEKAARKNLKPEIVPALTAVYDQLAALTVWQDEPIHEVVVKTAEQFDLKLGKLAQPIRVALTGDTVSPPLNETLKLIGKERSLQRISRALDYISQLGE